MITILSPAKNLDYQTKVSKELKNTKPLFLDEAEELISILQKKSAKDIGKLMHLSEKLSTLNYDRYQKWSKKHTKKNSRQNIVAFNGSAYLGLEATTLNESDLLYAQDHLRILSGLYGLLRPLDLMQEYRLEMGTKLKNNHGTNLYHFWNDEITTALNKDLKKNGKVLVNLASNEYYKSIQSKNIIGKIISCNFKDLSKSGEYKSIMTYAKTARGMMARFIIKNQINDPKDLVAFDSKGYIFSKKDSYENVLTFLRG